MSNKSFTLIELLVVIVIIGILAGVIMISTSSSIDKASFAKGQAFSSSIKNELFFNTISGWSFDEGGTIPNGQVTVNDLKDVHGDNDGSSVGNVYIRNGTECIKGKCIETYEDSYITVPDSNSLDEILQNYTIQLWIKLKSISFNRGVLIKGTSTSDATICIHFDAVFEGCSTAGFQFTKGIIEDCAGSPKLNEWVHIAYTQKDNIINIYRNGALVKSASNAPTNTANNAALMLGRNGTSGENLNGFLDEISIHDSALNSSQIKQNYIAGLNSLLSKGSISKLEYDKNLEALSQK